MISKRSRGQCIAFVFTLTAVLLIGATDGLGGRPGAKLQWTWSVEIPPAMNLYGDQKGAYEDCENVLVRVSREKQNAYRFSLRVRSGSGRQIGLQNVDLTNLAVDSSGGPGYFPADGCELPVEYCGEDCKSVFQGFLNQLHPFCDYAWAGLEITVSLDIEGMGVGETRQLENEYVGFDIIYDLDYILKDPDDQWHNMDAQNVPSPGTGQTARPSPLTIIRTGMNAWTIYCDNPTPYINYAEFYKTYFRGTRWTYTFPMAADGPFQFSTTWTRSLVGSQ